MLFMEYSPHPDILQDLLTKKWDGHFKVGEYFYLIAKHEDDTPGVHGNGCSCNGSVFLSLRQLAHSFDILACHAIPRK